MGLTACLYLRHIDPDSFILQIILQTFLTQFSSVATHLVTAKGSIAKLGGELFDFVEVCIIIFRLNYFQPYISVFKGNLPSAINSYQIETNKVMNQPKTQYGCPVEVTVEVIGGKWKCTILWWLRRGSKRFGELMQLIPKISRKVLTQQLRELERDGLVQRQAYPERPPRVEYFLTSLGETLEPITDLMCDWGKEQMPGFNFGLLNLEGLNILIVTDNLDSGEQLRIELGTIRGARVSITSIAVILETLPQIQPDVIIVDLEEDRDDLNTLINRIQLWSTQLDTVIPTIALAELSETRTRAFGRGFKLVLIKPVEPSELVAAIANITGRLG